MSNLDQAIADMKRQLRLESKAYLVKSWIGLYAQNVQYAHRIMELEQKIGELSKQPSGGTNEESDSGTISTT